MEAPFRSLSYHVPRFAGPPDKQLGAQFEAGSLHSCGAHPHLPPPPPRRPLLVPLILQSSGCGRSHERYPSTCRDPRSGTQAVMASPCVWHFHVWEIRWRGRTSAFVGGGGTCGLHFFLRCVKFRGDRPYARAGGASGLSLGNGRSRQWRPRR